MNDLFSKVKEKVLCSEVVQTYTQQSLKKRGRYHYGFCPFHSDEKMGSFVVDDNRRKITCYTGCFSGDAIDFVSKLNGISVKEATALIARDFSIITEEEYSGIVQNPSKRIKTANVPKADKKINATEIIAPIKDLDKVFTSFARICGLSEKDKEYLIKERKISEERLKDFFTMPFTKKQVNRVMALLKKDLKDLSVLEHIPGFYFNQKEGKWDCMTIKGIGLLIRNCSQKVIGIQVRKTRVKEDESRYIWFASSFADGKEGKEKGTGAGSPVDVVLPKKKINRIVITEGKFKAIALADMGYLALSIQGVGNWRKAFEVAKRCKLENKQFLIALDSDFISNKGVQGSILALGEALSKEGPTKVLVWKGEYGKGIDDVILNGNTSHVQALAFNEFKARAEKHQKTKG